MELVKNIFFNTDKLVENNKVKISYAGNFFQSGEKDVYFNYSFGEQKHFENSESEIIGKKTEPTELKMQKTELGFQAEIMLDQPTSLNFFFKNEQGDFDNNNGKNYVFEIEPAPKDFSKCQITDLVVVKNKSMGFSRLPKTYLWSKRAKLTIYKILTYIPKIISGNYKRRVIE